jgi:Lon protease-like protein
MENRRLLHSPGTRPATVRWLRQPFPSTTAGLLLLSVINGKLVRGFQLPLPTIFGSVSVPGTPLRSTSTCTAPLAGFNLGEVEDQVQIAVRTIIKPPHSTAAPRVGFRSQANLVECLIRRGKKLAVQPGGEPSAAVTLSTSSRSLNYGMRVPLFVDIGDYTEDYFSYPIPAFKLPHSTIGMYALEVHGSLNQALILDSPSMAGCRVFGHVSLGTADKEYSSTPIVKDADDDELPTSLLAKLRESLVGSIGCLSQIHRILDDEGHGDCEQKRSIVLCAGMLRFRVREIVQSEPYPVAIVDELYDSYDDADHTGVINGSVIGARDCSLMLFERTFHLVVDFLSRLESSLGESAAEPAKAWDEFMEVSMPFLSDKDIIQFRYNLAFMVASLTSANDSIRRQLVECTNANERLYILVKDVERKLEAMDGNDRTAANSESDVTRQSVSAKVELGFQSARQAMFGSVWVPIAPLPLAFFNTGEGKGHLRIGARPVCKPPLRTAPSAVRPGSIYEGEGSNLDLLERLVMNGKKLSVESGGEHSIIPPEDLWSTGSWPRPLNRGLRVPLFVDTGDNANDFSYPIPTVMFPHWIVGMCALEVNDPLSQALILDSPSIEGLSTIGHVAMGSRDQVYNPKLNGKAADHPDLQRESLVGAIGCISHIVRILDDQGGHRQNHSKPLHVLCMGGMRFRVREIVESGPHPVAIIDEVFDSCDDVDLDKNSDCRQLLIQLITTAKEFLSCDSSILGDAPAEAWNAFLLAVTPRVATPEKTNIFRYSLAFIVAELMGANDAFRRKLVECTNGNERMRLVLECLEHKIEMLRGKAPSGANEESDATRQLVGAKKMQIDLGQSTRTATEDLPGFGKIAALLGHESRLEDIPVWVQALLRKGSRIEYYWNNECRWCSGTVQGDVAYFVNGLAVPIRFDDDTTVRILPLSGLDLIRWRREGSFLPGY